MEELLFSYPSYKVGGPQILIGRLVEEANKRGLIPYVIDFKDGMVFKILKEKDLKVNTIFYEELKNGICKSMEKISYHWLIFYDVNNFWLINKLPKYFKISPLIWNVHPKNMLNGFSGLLRISKNNPEIEKTIAKLFYGEIYAKHKKILSELIEKDGIVFMDEGNFLYNKNLFSLKEEVNEINYLPIPIDLNKNNTWLNYHDRSDNLTVGWLGNFADFKVPMLIKVLQDIDNIIKNKKKVINFLIIGEGELKNLILKNLKKLNDIRDSVRFISTIRGSKLDQELLKMDILFAMGTSALEGAKLGVPTILLDASYTIPTFYKYKWIFETQNYSLGGLLHKYSHEISNNRLMGDILFNSNYKEISAKSFEYTKKHDIKKVFDSLIYYLNKSSFNPKFINEIGLFESIKNSLFYKIKNIKNKIFKENF